MKLWGGPVEPLPSALPAPHLIGSIPPVKLYQTRKTTPQQGGFSYLVEPRGIEPLSESNLTRLSPSAVYYLHSLNPAGTNTLRESVAS